MNNNNVMLGGSLSGIEVEKRDSRPRKIKRVLIGPSLKDIHKIVEETNNQIKLSNAQKEIASLEQKVKDLEEEIRKKDALSIEKDKQIHRLKEDKEILSSELMCKEEMMNSKEFSDEVGKKYLQKVFMAYLRGSKRWGVQRREKEYDRLEHFLSLDDVSQDVKEMIEALTEGNDESKTTNIYDIHDNKEVNTK